VTIDDHIEITTPEGVRITLSVVGIGARFLARLLDSLIQVGVLIGIALVGGAIGDSGFVRAGIGIAIFLVAVGYDFVFEPLMQGQTPGKKAAGIRIVDREGRPVTFLATAIRNTVRLIDFLPFLYGVGFVTMIATEHAQRLGDLAAGTIVVRDRQTSEAEVRLRSSHAIPTVPVHAVASWDVTLVTQQDIATIRHFLDRRISLAPHSRHDLAVTLARQIAPRVVGLPSNAHPEYVLEGIVVAKERS
jgi:uncharacterized RDD family membrane protein YckC